MARIPRRLTGRRPLCLLHNGDRMTRSEFHRAYCAMPEDYRAELIGGLVFEPSPVGWSHGDSHVELTYLLETYARRTPGVDLGDNVSVFLSPEDEVQPDLVLRILPEYGGQCSLTRKGYVQNAPELVAEVAHSSRAIDLHLKKDRYALAGVIEYIILCLSPKRLYWFALNEKTELEADRDGVFRSVVFPGLWIHADALLQLDHDLTLIILNDGLQTAEHRAFISRLAQHRKQ